jgi:hypothetical protein
MHLEIIGRSRCGKSTFLEHQILNALGGLFSSTRTGTAPSELPIPFPATTGTPQRQGSDLIRSRSVKDIPVLEDPFKAAKPMPELFVQGWQRALFLNSPTASKAPA